MWEIIVRKDPWPELNMIQASFEVIRQKRMPIPSYCPKYLAAIIESCWSVDPNDRPDFATICDLLPRGDPIL